MKKNVVIPVLVFALCNLSISFGQQANTPVPMIDGKVNFNEVVPVEGVKKDVLYGRAKLWFANSFKAANNVIQLDDKDNGVVLGKGTSFTEDMWNTNTWMFTVKIQLKDEKYKVEFYDIQKKYRTKLTGNYGQPMAPEMVQDINSIFNNPKIYKKDGELKEHIVKLASEADQVFSPLLKNLKKAMLESSSDF